MSIIPGKLVSRVNVCAALALVLGVTILLAAKFDGDGPVDPAPRMHAASVNFQNK